MMRFVFLLIWMVPAFVLAVTCFADYVFDRDGSALLMFKRIGLAVVWPFAALSTKGREVLFNTLKGVNDDE